MSGVNIGVDSGASRTRIRLDGAVAIGFTTPRNYLDYLDVLVKNLNGQQLINNVVLAVPSIVENGRPLAPPNLGDGWHQIDLASDIRLRCPNIRGNVTVVQDTAAAAVGLKGIGAIEQRPALMLTLSTGLGGAVIWEDSLQPLEVGHAILNLSGRQSRCNCGQVGCAEADLSGSAIANQVRDVGRMIDNDFWTEYGTLLGRFLGVLAPVFRTREILLIGGVTANAPRFLPSCQLVLERALARIPVPKLTVVPNSDGVGAYGAWLLAGEL